MAYKNQKIEKF